jgi:hypothetical protein
LFLSILHSRFSRFFFSLPATIFQLAVGLRFQFFLRLFPFFFRLVLSFVRPTSAFHFFSSLSSLRFFSLSLYFKFTGRALGYRYRDPPQAILPIPAAVG